MSNLQCDTTLWVARHGKAEFVERHFSDEGGSLVPAGRAQAKSLAERLTHERIAVAYSSDVSRAVQTAEIAAAHLGVSNSAHKSLREVYIGSLLGTPFDVALIEAVADRWHAGELSARFPDGESGHDVLQRYSEQLAAIADLHRGESVLVVGHQTALAIVLRQLVGGADDEQAYQLDNGEALKIVGDGTRWQLAT